MSMNHNNRTFSEKIINRCGKVAKRRLEKLRTTPVRIHNKLRLSTSISDKSHTWRYVTPTRETWIRAKTMLTKEPETLEWIESFDQDDVLWDIGANVGIFSLYASLIGNRVLAFEPAPGNYYLLSRNIEINDFDEKISAYCICLLYTSPSPRD